MTTALARRELDGRFDSVGARAITAVVVIGLVAGVSQPTSRAISPLGIAALVVAAVPYVFREFPGRAALVPAVPLLLCTASPTRCGTPR